MTRPDRGAERNPSCTARTSVGIAVVAAVAVAVAVLLIRWWLQ
jgi:hypothetical protein